MLHVPGFTLTLRKHSSIAQSAEWGKTTPLHADQARSILAYETVDVHSSSYRGDYVGRDMQAFQSKENPLTLSQ